MGTGNILITGIPGIGKTTIIKEIVAELGDRAGGFYTQELKEGNRRVGFRIITLDDQTGILSSHYHTSDHYIGKFAVNIQDLDEIGVKSIMRAISDKDIIVIDEIGKMECISRAFREGVKSALGSDKKVIAVIQLTHNYFADEIKLRDDVNIIAVTEANRDTVKQDILKLLA
jgi:nucleoside-triphosphatase